MSEPKFKTKLLFLKLASLLVIFIPEYGTTIPSVILVRIPRDTLVLLSSALSWVSSARSLVVAYKVPLKLLQVSLHIPHCLVLAAKISPVTSPELLDWHAGF